jgi:hypothetical protein
LGGAATHLTIYDPEVRHLGAGFGRDLLWLVLVPLLAALAATIAPMSAVDLAYQVRAGDLMLSSGAVLRVDPFTFTAFGLPWLNQQWGAGVLFAAVHGLAGWGGLVALRALLVGAAVALVMTAALRWLPARPAALLALAGLVVGIASLGLRAQLLGIVLFAAVLAILAWRDRRPRLAWLVPLLVLAWANLHGSFFLGPAAVAVALVGDILARRPGVRTLLPVLVASLVASCVTPFGPRVWEYALGIATNGEITRLITEWQRTSPLTVTGALFYASVAGAAALVLLARHRRLMLSWPTLAWLVALAFLGAYAERGVAWWAFGAPVALAPTAAALLGPARTPREEPRALRRLNVAVVFVLGLAVIAVQPLWRGGDSLVGPTGLLRDAPAGLARALRGLASKSDRVVVPQPWASWFEWAAPGVPVMVDSRVEVVPASVWADYLVIAAGGPGALTKLARIEATVVVVDPATQPALYIALGTTGSGWRLAYEGEDGAIFILER